MPDTILSRCQQFDFRQIPVDKIFKRLREIADAEQVNITNEALREVARAGNGSLRDAQSALDQVISFSGAEITEVDVTHSLGLVSTKILGQTIESIAERDTAGLLKVVEELDSSGHDLRFFSRELMTYFRHLLVIKTGITSSDVLGISETEIATLKQISSKFSEEDLVRFFHLLTEIEKQIKDSLQPRFQLEIGLVKIAHATRLRALDEVIKRLEELESRLSGGNLSANSSVLMPSKSPSVVRADLPSANLQRTTPPPKESRAFVAADSLDEPPGFSDSFARNSFEERASARAPEPTHGSIEKPVAASSVSVAPGQEIEAIKMELEKRRKPLIVMALEEARVAYEEGKLIATFASENAFSKRLKDSADLFREVGEYLLGQPLRLEVKLNGEAVVTPLQESRQAREKLIESVKDNPAVKMLLETFRGEIVDVQDATA